jgi:hypothetical protein
MNYTNRTPELCQFLNQMQALADAADSRARNLMLGEDARMKAAAARDAYFAALSIADITFGGMWND